MRIVLRFLKQASLFLLVLIGLAKTPSSIGATVFRYVNTNVQGGAGNGTSWANAYEFLQDALDDAQSATEQNPYQIWVAAGTYYPDRSAANPEGSDDPGASFTLDTNNVRVFGGFTGSESSLNQRDIFANVTVLTGLIHEPPQSELHALHVVTVSGVDFTVTLDGFTIEEGDGIPQAESGGGMLITDASPNVLRCIFRDNRGHDGGALAIKLESGAVIYNCLFEDNFAHNSGGAIHANTSAAAVVLNCLFAHNEVIRIPLGSVANGGAIYNSSSPGLNVINCTITENDAERFGGGIFNDASSTLTVKNSIPWDNTDGQSASVAAEQLAGIGSISVSYTDLEQSSGVYTGTGNINEDPDFVDPSTGVYRLLSTSPCIDEADGDYIVDNHPDAFDLDQDDNGDPDEPTPDLVLNCRVVDDTTSPDGGGSGDYPFADMGAYEYQVDARADCPADIFPVAGNDWNVGEGDLGELLANWGSCSAPCPADLFPVGNPDGTVGAGDLGELIANWGMCATIQCETDFGDSLMGGGGGGGGGGGESFGEQHWPEVELTEELYDWLTSATLDEIIEWLWSLLEQ